VLEDLLDVEFHLHHIHHLSPRIQNYNLEKCHHAEPLFQTVKPVTLFKMRLVVGTK
jgi:fatty acid desaturase